MVKMGHRESGLTPEELERYDRQIRIPDFGIKRQKRLKASTVVVAGIGGLGCTASLCLAAAGFGSLILIDKDLVKLNNLNRQILHWIRDIGKKKSDSAAYKLRELNSTIRVRGIAVEIGEKNVYELIRGATVVIDGQDNFRTRFVLNRACVDLNIPFVHAAVHGFDGRLMTIIPKRGPCLNCLLMTEPPEIEPIPVIGATAAVMASLQALEAIKLAAGIGEISLGKMTVFDGKRLKFDLIHVKRRSNCSVCGERENKA
jgi:adenylyltransferase/sulfurtransferase